MAAAPTKQSITNLYTSMLRTSQSFSSYNFRSYFTRRTESTFKDIENETDPAKLSAFYAEKTKELAVLERSAVVNQLYAGPKLVVEE
ncbi:uncharacterized protein BXZ73DRAFT_102731 [Epithele typhae]|uniref:uncharacterized protein n=1 Tax=Epithele typhae TaxID=378194 RepID=UPI002007CC26|nr:uncharacterized protein BXZ73DRAFT_102731 [Epithele typhae]KAH9927142.1 hypothetical protein BXZ73DRAFT_102731 [Epithele typhae]